MADVALAIPSSEWGTFGIPIFHSKQMSKSNISLKNFNFPCKNVALLWCNMKIRIKKEYMFLLAGNSMPGSEKFWGELLFPEEKWLLFSTEGRKNSFSKRNKCSSQNFFDPGIMFFSLEDTFSSYFILWPAISLYILMAYVSY